MEKQTKIILGLSFISLAIIGFSFKAKIMAMFERSKKENRDIVISR